MLWDNTVNKAYRVKGEIQPLQNAAADGVRKDIGAFGEEVRFSKTRLATIGGSRTSPFCFSRSESLRRVTMSSISLQSFIKVLVCVFSLAV